MDSQESRSRQRLAVLQRIRNRTVEAGNTNSGFIEVTAEEMIALQGAKGDAGPPQDAEATPAPGPLKPAEYVPHNASHLFSSRSFVRAKSSGMADRYQ